MVISSMDEINTSLHSARSGRLSPRPGPRYARLLRLRAPWTGPHGIPHHHDAPGFNLASFGNFLKQARGRLLRQVVIVAAIDKFEVTMDLQHIQGLPRQVAVVRGRQRGAHAMRVQPLDRLPHRTQGFHHVRVGRLDMTGEKASAISCSASCHSHPCWNSTVATITSVLCSGTTASGPEPALARVSG